MRLGWADLREAPEVALIIAAQGRDQAAFAELVRRRQGWMRALMTRLCGDAAEADDLAQETFLRAWDRLDELRQPLAFGAWLRRIAVMRLLRSRRLRILDVDPTVESDDLLAEDPLPDRAAVARIDLDRALAVLSAPERLCVTLNLGEGLSHGEIVQLTNLPLGTVKSHIARGQAKLRRVLGDAHD